MKRAVYLLIAVCAAMGARAHDVVCTVTYGTDWTKYSVPEINATDCEFSWANDTEVMANHESEIKPLVLNNTRNVLIIQTCFEQIHYKRDCISEGISRRVTCNATCSKNAGARINKKGALTQSRGHIYIVPAFIIVLLVIFLLVIRYRRRRSSAGADAEAQNG